MVDNNASLSGARCEMRVDGDNNLERRRVKKDALQGPLDGRRSCRPSHLSSFPPRSAPGFNVFLPRAPPSDHMLTCTWLHDVGFSSR
jgi:hypothetical protein